LMAIFQHLLLQANGDVDRTLQYMKRLQEMGYLDKAADLAKFRESLQEKQIIDESKGFPTLTSKGERMIRQDALNRIFNNLKRGNVGEHRTPQSGEGGDRLPETRPWAFGEDLSGIDVQRTMHNSLLRTGPELQLAEEDFEVNEREHLTSCATVLLLDISHSMILYGEDRITPAKTVALALTELITTKYPKDHLSVILFGDRAEQVFLSEIPYIQAGPFHTNTRDALQLSRSILARQKQPNKQIFLITDGKPSAITENGRIYKNPFGLDMRIVNLTLEEADLCRRQKVVITTFMLATDTMLTQFVEKLTQINRGRAYFASPYNLGEFILADYIRNRRRRVR
ncbi:MAG TPA: VWA domain-containing protein, partial [Thermoanaerobaculia bacterium]